MNSRRALAFLLLFVLSGSAARAEYILFDDVNDTIDVSGQTVLGSAATFEAVVMFPTGTGADGAIFEEHLAFGEDKQLQAGPSFLRGFAYNSTCCLQSTDPIAPDVFHHVAYVLDGAANEERLYVDGSLVASRTTASFDVSDADGTAHIGATDRDGAVLDASFRGFLDSVRISDIARYSGASFTPPTGDMTSDANTLLLYNFDEPAGQRDGRRQRPARPDRDPRPGFRGRDRAGARRRSPSPAALGHFLCYKAKSTKGDVCSAAAPLNAGAACDAEEDCGGSAETDVCVPNKLAKGVQVTLADPLAKVGRLVDVKKGAALCNPADKNGEGIDNPDDHLRSFTIKVAKGVPAFPTSDAVVLTNQFGTLSLATGKVDRLLIPAAKDPAAPVAAPEAPAIDHFRCAKVKVSKGAPRFEPIGRGLGGGPVRAAEALRPEEADAPVHAGRQERRGRARPARAAALLPGQARPRAAEAREAGPASTSPISSASSCSTP